MSRLIAILFSTFACCACEAFIGDEAEPEPESGTGFRVLQSVVSDDFMVSTAHPHASAAAAQLLRHGGNALDAAIVAQLVLNVVEPQSSGLGGGGFLLYFEASSGRLYAYQGRETAPQGMLPDAFLDDKGMPLAFMDASSSGAAVGVPGLLAMLSLAHERHGQLAWESLFTDAIRLAEQGFIVTPRLAHSIARHPFLKEQDRDGGFYSVDGMPLQAGVLYKNTALANRLRILAREGAASFYTAGFAETIVRAVRESKRQLPQGQGQLRRQDIIDYRAQADQPLCRPYREWRVCSIAPPSSGGVALLQTLRLLEPFDIAVLTEAERTHVVAEAMRLAYRDRARYLADDAYVAVPIEALLERSYLRLRGALLGRNRKAADIVIAGTLAAGRGETDSAEERESTTHLSLIDQQGNAVSMTTSIGPSFGSGIRVEGFYLNGELTDFSFLARDSQGRWLANRIEGGKRPLSSMSPVMVFDKQDQLRLIVGSAGGVHIIAYVLRVLVDILDAGYDVQEALSAGNYVKNKRENILLLEEGRDWQDIRGFLTEMNHVIMRRSMTSGLHAIFVDDMGRLWGGVDPRREGLAVGE